MREIKFRGRRLDNGEWIYGSLLVIEDTYFIIEPVDFSYNNDTGTTAFWFDSTEQEVDPATVGQYTGMKDKDGKEIYEGDVFHFTNEDGYECTSTVRYDEVDGCFSITESQYIYGVNYAIKHLNANLIGNIHDNPKLLEPE